MAHVRLHRAEQQRFGAVLAVGGQQRLRLDRVTQRRAGAVGFDDVHIGRTQPGVGQGGTDHALLSRSVRRHQAVRGTVLVHRRAANDRQDGVSVAHGVGHAFQHDHAGALGPAHTVGGVGERLATTIRRQATLPGELDQRGRRRHDRHATGQRQRTLPRAQGLHGPVHCDQRRRAGGVDRDGRAFQAQGVGDATGHDGR